MLSTVSDDVGDGDYFDIVLVGEIFQRFHTRHCAIVGHYFADDSGGVLTG